MVSNQCHVNFSFSWSYINLMAPVKHQMWQQTCLGLKYLNHLETAAGDSCCCLQWSESQVGLGMVRFRLQRMIPGLAPAHIFPQVRCVLMLPPVRNSQLMCQAYFFWLISRGNSIFRSLLLILSKHTSYFPWRLTYFSRKMPPMALPLHNEPDYCTIFHY